MTSLHRAVALPILLIASAACHGGGQKAGSVPTPIGPASRVTSNQASNLSPILEQLGSVDGTESMRQVENICTRAGGYFQFWECRCPDSEDGMPQFLDGSSGSCTSVKKALFRNQCFDATTNLQMECTVGPARNRIISFGSDRNVSLTMKLAQEDEPQFYSWFQRSADQLRISLPYVDSESDRGIFQVYLKKKPFDAIETKSMINRFVGDSLIVPSMGGINQQGIIPPIRVLYAADYPQLESLMGITQSETPPMPNVPLSDRDPNLSAALNVLKEIGTVNQPLRITKATTSSSRDVRDCASYCGFELEVGLEQPTDDLMAVLRLNFHRGVAEPPTLTILQRGSLREFSRVIYDWQGQVNLIATFAIGQEHGVGSRITRTTRVYDRQTNLLGENTDTVIDDPDRFQNIIDQARRMKLADEQVPVAIFEGGFPLDPEDSQAASKLLVSSKSPSPLVDWPTMGWSPGKDPVQLMQGLFPMMSLDQGRPDHSHAIAVAHAAIHAQYNGFLEVRPRTIRIANFGARIFAPDTASSIKQAILDTDGRLRVGAIALAFNRNSESCNSTLGSFLNSGLLFVSSAGNNSMPLDRGLLCPQNLVSKNLLIVAAGDRSGLAPYSNFGARIADLAANGDSLGMSGTSFAAPKVAAAMALLADLHPSSTAAELRAALILTADIPDLSRPLPVRSGGLVPQDLSSTAVALQNLALSGPDVRKEIGLRLPAHLAFRTLLRREPTADGSLTAASAARLRLLYQNDFLCRSSFETSVCQNESASCTSIMRELEPLPECSVANGER